MAIRATTGDGSGKPSKDALINTILDKLGLLLCCLSTSLIASGEVKLVPLTVAIALSAFSSYFERRAFTRAAAAAFLLGSLAFPDWAYFIPLFFYDSVLEENWLFAIAFILPAAFLRDKLPLAGVFAIALYLGIAWLFKRRTLRLDALEREHRRYVDEAKELMIAYESKNRELLEKQDYEINLATLNERNRIAREIHDNVGHVLSRALLQVGALMAVERDGGMVESLASLKETLSSGMESVRSSVHDLHDESIDLHAGVYSLIREFSFCDAEFDDQLETRPPLPIVYCMIAIVKEALSNIAKHSDATRAKISLYEHPALYQLVVADNGTKLAAAASGIKGADWTDASRLPGIGLKNIFDRAARLGGKVDIRARKGFEIFVSIPKPELEPTGRKQ